MHPDNENEQIRRKLYDMDGSSFTSGFDRAAAWSRLEPRLPVSRGRRFYWLPYSSVAAAALLLAFFVLRPDRGTKGPAVAASCKEPWPLSSAKLFPATEAVLQERSDTVPATITDEYVAPVAATVPTPAPAPKEKDIREEATIAAVPIPAPAQPHEKVYHINEIEEGLPAREEEKKGFFATMMNLKPIQASNDETVAQTHSSRFRFIHKN